MKKLLILCIVIILLGSGVGYILGKQVPKPAIMGAAPEPTVTPTPMLYAIPVNIKIPKLGVNTTVEQVGLDEKNNMDVPQKDMNVGWYEYGVKPGEKGNAVLAGHFDTKIGTNAVFYRLNELVTGDGVIITDENGKSYEFIIINKTTYPVEKFPIETVFGKSQERYIDLITCEGVWNPSKKIYEGRLVVRAKLKE